MGHFPSPYILVLLYDVRATTENPLALVRPRDYKGLCKQGALRDL
jgi:hypothetical protein